MTTTAHSTICTAKTKRGQPCKAYALAGSLFCFAHDPTNAAVRAAAHSAGGYARHGRKIGPVAAGEPVKVESLADLVKVLESEINSVLTLEKSLSRAQAIARLSAVFVSAFGAAELEARIAAMEEWRKGYVSKNEG